MRTLLIFLLNHFLFAGTMFAAAGTSLGSGGGTGAGSGAGSGAGAGAGSGAGDGAGAGEGGSADGDLGAGSGEGDDGISADGDTAAGTDGAGTADGKGNVTLADGRTVPASINKLFELAKTAGCEKEARQLYFGLERLKATVGGVNQAIELKKAFDQVGGAEGVQELQSEVETYQADSELFESGDPKWVQTAFEQNPDSALKAFDNSLQYVSDKHPEHYDHMMAQVVLDTLNGEGSPIGVVYNMLKAMKDNPQAAAAAEKIARWYNAIKKTAKNPPEKQVDARTKAINDREATVEQKETAQRYSQINATAFPQMKHDVKVSLEAEAKLVGVDLAKLSAEFPGAFQSMMRDIHLGIKSTAVKDKNFVNKYAALVKSGDTTRAATMLNKKHASIIPAIVRDIAGKSGLLKKPGKAAAGGAGEKDKGNAGAGAAGAGSAANGYTKVNAKPANHLIDYRKTSPTMQMDGLYILKDGKRVQVHY
jgi:hypothetical protein